MASNRGHGKRQRSDNNGERGFASGSRQTESGARPPKRPRFYGPGGGWQEQGQASQSRSSDSHSVRFGGEDTRQEDHWGQLSQPHSLGRVPMGKNKIFDWCRFSAKFFTVLSPRGHWPASFAVFVLGDLLVSVVKSLCSYSIMFGFPSSAYDHWLLLFCLIVIVQM